MVVPTAPPISDVEPDIRGMDVETLNKLYPPKREPMPDPIKQLRHFVAIIDVLTRFFDLTGRAVAVIGDCFIYYVDERGSRQSVAPDVCVSFDVSLDDLDNDNSYYVERMGKPPDFVMEIGSASTATRDVEEKPAIYASLGVEQFWLFDPEGGRHYGFPLMGFRLVDGEYAPIELTCLPNGGVRGYSEALALFILWDGDALRFIDPATGRSLRTSAELEADEREARRELDELRRMLSER